MIEIFNYITLKEMFHWSKKTLLQTERDILYLFICVNIYFLYIIKKILLAKKKTLTCAARATVFN